MEQDRDLQLINSINDGDRSAAADLYHRYIGFLTALCSRYVLDRNDVRDILQTSFVKILSSISRFQYRGPGSLKAWMSRIVVNESLKFLQASRKSGDFKEEFMKDRAQPQRDSINAGYHRKHIGITVSQGEKYARKEDKGIQEQSKQVKDYGQPMGIKTAGKDGRLLRA